MPSSALGLSCDRHVDRVLGAANRAYVSPSPDAAKLSGCQPRPPLGWSGETVCYLAFSGSVQAANSSLSTKRISSWLIARTSRGNQLNLWIR